MGPIFTLLSLCLPVCLFFTLLAFLRRTRNARRWKCGFLPSYPGGLLGISSLKQALRADKEKMVPHLAVARVAEMTAREGRYVSTFGLRQAMRDTIFTCDPKNIQALLATQFKDFELGQARHRMLQPLLGAGIFTADREYWSHSRAILRPHFTREQISDLSLEERHVQKAFHAMPADFTTGWTAAIDIQSIFFRLTMDTATEFLFGESVESQTAALNGVEGPMDLFPYYFDRGQWYAAQRARFENLYWLVDNKESRRADAQVHEYVDRIVAAALADKGKTNEKQKYVFIQGLAITTQDPVELRSQLLHILLAGRDTTASLLSWSILLLARQPAIFAKLRATILRDFSARKAITYASLKDCRYLQAFLNEVLRLYPIVPTNRRTAVKDTTIPRGGGSDGSAPVYVRKGQTVIYSTFALQRRKDLWGPDSLVFEPDRWIDCRPGWNYLPFNGGPRICIGQQFALTETGYVLVRLLQHFDQIVDTQPELPILYKVNLTSAPGNNVTVKMHVAQESKNEDFEAS